MSFPLAFAIGFAVASLPGPILVLITTETLRKGPRAGVLAMIAPLIIDAIVMLPLALLLQVSLVTGRGIIGELYSSLPTPSGQRGLFLR